MVKRTNTGVPNLLLIVWALIIVFTGSYFRLRAGDGAPSLDWLIMTRLVVCGLGVVVAMPWLLLLKRRPACLWFVAFYVGAIGFTLPSSINPLTSTGYFVLLAGGILTTLAVVQQGESRADLLDKEAFLAGVLIFCLLKDAAIAFTSGGESGSGRLGISDSADELGLLAAVVFIMQLGRQRHPGLRYGLLGFCLVIVTLSKSRGSMVSLAIGAAVYLWKAADARQERPILLKVAASSLVMSALFGGMLLYVASFPGIRSAVLAVNRNEDMNSLESITTGRTIVWNNAVQILHAETVSPLILGNGYGLSRLPLNQNNRPGDEFFAHAHNTVLDSLVSVGMVGTIALAGLCCTALIAVVRRKKCSAHPMSSRAAAVICAIVATFPTESYLSMRLSWMHIAFVFSLCVCYARRESSAGVMRNMH